MTNQLINEKSPYLLQHAHNPVDWQAWNEIAFARAAAEDKPIFLSIGYATCHWCHVMESESFQDPAVATELNDGFVCIKVDREERPDIDSVYMTACQMLTGSGGWPLNIFMTPDKRPFFAATYIPKNNRFGRSGLIELCRRISDLWHHQPAKIRDSAESVTAALQSAFEFDTSQKPDRSLLEKAYRHLRQNYDPSDGGFESAPKFPTPHRLLFLLRRHARSGEQAPLDMVLHTLDAMRMGGIWDHVGFGFHRYSTDNRWLLPHFEKMLYDQAMISLAYLEAYRVTGRRRYASTAEEIFTYVLRDMTADSGAFFSAEDADSEGEEGRFYLWHMDEITAILDAETAETWASIFNLAPAGNFTDAATGGRTGANILHLKNNLEHWSRALDIPVAELRNQWQAVRKILLKQRSERVRPLLDDKILCDWNGLMIAALATGGRMLQQPPLIEAAEKAAAFILTGMRDPNGRLYHRYRDGDLAVPALAGDYACLVFGLLNLYHSTLNQGYAETARDLQEEMTADFRDRAGGGFFLTAEGRSELPIRPKEFYDGAIPSVNSMALMNLLMLGRLTGESRWGRLAGELVGAFGEPVFKHPSGFAFFLTALDYALHPGQEIIVSGPARPPENR